MISRFGVFNEAGPIRLDELSVEECSRRQQGAPWLVQAARAGSHHLVELLLNLGIDPNGSDGHGRTPAAAAAQAGSIRILELLFAHGASLAQDATPQNRCLIHSACWAGSGACIRFLRTQGHSLNDFDPNGRPPIMYAIQHGFGGGGALDAMIELGANLSILDSESRGILDYASHLDPTEGSKLRRAILAQYERDEIHKAIASSALANKMDIRL